MFKNRIRVSGNEKCLKAIRLEGIVRPFYIFDVRNFFRRLLLKPSSRTLRKGRVLPIQTTSVFSK